MEAHGTSQLLETGLRTLLTVLLTGLTSTKSKVFPKRASRMGPVYLFYRDLKDGHLFCIGLEWHFVMPIVAHT